MTETAGGSRSIVLIDRCDVCSEVLFVAGCDVIAGGIGDLRLSSKQRKVRLRVSTLLYVYSIILTAMVTCILM